MSVAQRPITHEQDGQAFESMLVHPDGPGARPGVLIFPTIMGRSELEIGFARQIAGLGYAAMVADLYGRENIGRSREECRTLMDGLRGDRPALQARLLAALDVMKSLPEVDGGRAAAIGYCFGGLCALDLARTGTDVRGVASFHGLFTPPGNLDGVKIRASVIAFHGWDDPLAPPAAVEALGKELSEAGADWQIHAYGGTLHGFTNPAANDPAHGLQYNPTVAARAWRSLEGFLEECLGSEPMAGGGRDGSDFAGRRGERRERC